MKLLRLYLATMLVASVTQAADDSEQRRFDLMRHFELAKQPTLGVLKEARVEGCRFIFHDGGMTSSVVVLIQKVGQRVSMSAGRVSLHDYYGSEGKKGVERVGRSLSSDEWTQLSDKLEKLDPWRYQLTGSFGLDGDYWILEVFKDGKSRRITEWSPEAGEYRELCLDVWRASGLFMGWYANKTR